MIQFIKQIRQHYSEITPRILERRYPQRWVSPYSDLVDWNKLFSPIEEQTWMALRSFGKLPMYPQYPVKNFFVDFGNPFLKIAIECDGKEWHTDKAKDNKRDDILLGEGWHVYRITGADCLKGCPEYENRFDENYEKAISILNKHYSVIEGLIKALAIFYNGHYDYNYFDKEIDLIYDCLVHSISMAQSESVQHFLRKMRYHLHDEYLDWKYKEENKK